MRVVKSQRNDNREVRLARVRSGELRPKDVKNEGWPDYMHENTGSSDKMSPDRLTFLDENAQG
jgi:hypothetical protein